MQVYTLFFKHLPHDTATPCYFLGLIAQSWCGSFHFPRYEIDNHAQVSLIARGFQWPWPVNRISNKATKQQLMICIFPCHADCINQTTAKLYPVNFHQPAALWLALNLSSLGAKESTLWVYFVQIPTDPDSGGVYQDQYPNQAGFHTQHCVDVPFGRDQTLHGGNTLTISAKCGSASTYQIQIAVDQNQSRCGDRSNKRCTGVYTAQTLACNIILKIIQ